MFSIPRFSRQTRSLMFLGICLLILSVIPAQRAHALTIPQEVDNTLDEFSRGGFQRSSLAGTKVDPAAPDPAPRPKVTDKAGAIQLLPIGILKNWNNPGFLLPNPLMDMGAVAIGRNIFVLGGSTKIGNTPQLTKDVWSLQIDQETGVPKDTGTPNSWFDETQDLPAVQTSTTTGYKTPYAPRSKMAITAITTGLDSGYIYVVGGNVQSGTGSASGFDISSFAVNIATVSGGHITSWAEGQRVPADPDLGDVGILGATALSFTSGGNTYIYLFGGLQRYQEDQNSVDVPSRRVFYARVGSGGQLVKPSGGSGSNPVWAELPSIEVVSPQGLWDAAGVIDHFDIGGGVGGDVLFLMGGQTSTNEYNSRVFRATINSSNGALTWQTDPTPPTLPEKRTRMAAVQVNGNLYVTGGQAVSGVTLGRPQKEILTTYVEDDLTLAILGENGNSNFLRTTPPPLPLPRAGHGSVVIQSAPTVAEPNSAFVYVIAGQGDDTDTDTTDDQGSRTLIYGKVGNSENTQETGFATSGWFYSAAHSTAKNFNGEQVQEIHWTADIDRSKGGLDIVMQYRLSTVDDCDAPGAFDGAQWNGPLDSSPNDSFYSVNSGNKFALDNPISAHCFQYRAKLITTNSKATPALLNVSILVKIPGSPDLTVRDVKEQRGVDGKMLTGLFVSIQNHNESPTTPTLAADLAGPGWFYVDLCVFGPGEAVDPPHLPLSDADPQCSDAYAEVNKSVMGVDAVFSVTQWCKTRPENTCLPIDVLSLFDKPGDFTVIAAVDTYDYVLEEPTDPAEQNNVTRTPYPVITVYADPDDPTKPDIGHGISLSIIRR